MRQDSLPGPPGSSPRPGQAVNTWTFAAEEVITDKAACLGWTVVSIRDDWDKVFPP